VRAPQISRRFERRQIAPDRRNRRFDVLGEFFQRREFHALKIGFNAVFALFCGHVSINLIDFGIICKINVDLNLKTVKVSQILWL
jgi:hypothetical protein